MIHLATRHWVLKKMTIQFHEKMTGEECFPCNIKNDFDFADIDILFEAVTHLMSNAE